MNKKKLLIRIKDNKKSICLLFIVSIILVLTAIFTKNLTSKNQSIIFTSSGFSPNTLTVSPGTTVTFINKTDKPFWPASDPHPSHSMLSELDPKKAILPNERWSFTFNNTGIWTYHDHLYPGYIGTIRVGKNSQMALYTPELCNKAEEKIKECWDNLAIQTVQKKGIEEAFVLVEELASRKDLRGWNCHSFTHAIGHASGTQLQRDQETQRKTKLGSYIFTCANGFLHGLFGAIPDKKTLLEKKEKCLQLSNHIEQNATTILNECYHGIGHGIVTTISDPERDLPSLINRNKEWCGLLETTGKNCMNATIGEIMANKKVNAYIKTQFADNPFEICKFFEDDKPACYQEVTQFIVVPEIGIEYKNITTLSIAEKLEMLVFAQSIPETRLATQPLEILMRIIAREDKSGGYANNLPVCSQLQPRLKQACVIAIAEGILARAGHKSVEYETVYNLCTENSLEEPIRDMCFKRLIGITRDSITEEKWDALCKKTPYTYKHYCGMKYYTIPSSQ